MFLVICVQEACTRYINGNVHTCSLDTQSTRRQLFMIWITVVIFNSWTYFHPIGGSKSWDSSNYIFLFFHVFIEYFNMLNRHQNNTHLLLILDVEINCLKLEHKVSLLNKNWHTCNNVFSRSKLTLWYLWYFSLEVYKSKHFDCFFLYKFNLGFCHTCTCVCFFVAFVLQTSDSRGYT